MNYKLEKIDRAETLKYLAYHGNKPDDKTAALMDKCEEMLLKAAVPKYSYRIFGIAELSENGVRLAGCSFTMRGDAIKKHLAGCEKAALLCATVGNGADTLIRTLQVRDMAAAVIADAMAGSAVEQVCNEAERVIGERFPDMFMTWRFSPGYDDFPIEQQTDFLDVIDAGRAAGIYVTRGGLLTPIKSVTAVIGLSDKPVEHKGGKCAACSMRESCNYSCRKK